MFDGRPDNFSVSIEKQAASIVATAERSFTLTGSRAKSGSRCEKFDSTETKTDAPLPMRPLRD
jgi:hypothetical protein